MSMRFFSIFALTVLPFVNNAQLVTTVAGNGNMGYGGDGGQATNASIGGVGTIAFDSSGNYYLSELNNTIRKVSNNGIISKVAGNGTTGYSGDSGLAVNAQFNGGGYIAVDRYGNFYISETFSNRIRKVNVATGIVTTIAGNGAAGFSGDSGPATAAQINWPYGICFDPMGNLYIADQLNYRIRKVDIGGIISTVAGNGVDASGGDNGLASSATIYKPLAICSDNFGNIYFTDSGRVRKINMTSGIISAYAGNGTVGNGGDGGLATSAQLYYPVGLTIDGGGNLYISNATGNNIRKVNSVEIISTVVGTGIAGYNGDGGNADTTKLYSPRGIALDSCGNLYIADNGNKRVRKVTFHPDCFPESVKYVNKENEISIYPNPAKEQLNIECSSGIKELRVMNTIGQVLIEQKNYAEKAIVNVNGLSSGVYFIQMSDKDGQVATRRFVKE